MKIVITEQQLKLAINTLSEVYVKDPYLDWDYEPTQAEIDAFNKVDKPPRINLSNYYAKMDKDAKVKNVALPKPAKKVPSGKKYTGMATIMYMYPGGKHVEVKDSFGQVAIVTKKLQMIRKNVNKSEGVRYYIKYEEKQ